MADDLTSKMAGFAQAVVDPDNSKSDAYRLHYNTENMSPQVVNNEASKLMKLPKVAARIQELRDAVQERAMVSKTDMLLELKRIAYSDLSDLAEWNGRTVSLKDSDDLSPELTRLVSEVSETKQGVKIKLHDKMDAFDKMAKMTGAYNEPERQGDIHITKVTVVLSGAIDGEVEREETHFVDANYEVLPEDGDDVPVDEGG